MRVQDLDFVIQMYLYKLIFQYELTTAKEDFE